MDIHRMNEKPNLERESLQMFEQSKISERLTYDLSKALKEENAGSMSLAKLTTVGIFFWVMRGFTRLIREMFSSAPRFQQTSFESAGHSEEMSEGSAEPRPQRNRH
jgi:hypothetical protein